MWDPEGVTGTVVSALTKGFGQHLCLFFLPPKLTHKGGDGLAIALDACQTAASGRICQNDMLAQRRGKHSPVICNRDWATGVDWPNDLAGLECCLVRLLGGHAVYRWEAEGCEDDWVAAEASRQFYGTAIH